MKRRDLICALLALSACSCAPAWGQSCAVAAQALQEFFNSVQPNTANMALADAVQKDGTNLCAGAFTLGAGSAIAGDASLPLLGQVDANIGVSANSAFGHARAAIFTGLPLANGMTLLTHGLAKSSYKDILTIGGTRGEEVQITVSGRVLWGVSDGNLGSYSISSQAYLLQHGTLFDVDGHGAVGDGTVVDSGTGIVPGTFARSKSFSFSRWVPQASTVDLLHVLTLEAQGGTDLFAGDSALITSITTDVPVPISAASGDLLLLDGEYVYRAVVPEPGILMLTLVGAGLLALANLARRC